ncbi:MAG: response regulator [Nanoarchaeota archaeon]
MESLDKKEIERKNLHYALQNLYLTQEQSQRICKRVSERICERPQQDTELSEDIERKKPRIIYAEDKPLVRKPVSLFLEKYFDIDECHCGNALKKRLEDIAQKGAGNTRFILTDNQMPGHTGLELIKKYASHGNMPPMVLFYGGDPDIGEKAVEYGAHCYIEKPLDIAGIRDTLLSVIQGHNKDKTQDNV